MSHGQIPSISFKGQHSRTPLKPITDYSANKMMSSPREAPTENFNFLKAAPHSVGIPFTKETNRPRLYTEFNGATLYHDGNELMHRQSYYNDELQPDRKRSKTENNNSFTVAREGHFHRHIDLQETNLSSSFNRTGGNDGNYTYLNHEAPKIEVVVSESSKDDASISSNNEGQPQLLALPGDKQHLTELHCFVRRHCVYIFCAKFDEVDGELPYFIRLSISYR